MVAARTKKKAPAASRKKAVKAVKKPTGVCVGSKVVAKPSYTPAEVAEILGIGRATVADKMDKGLLKFEKLFDTPGGFQRGARKKKAPEIRRIPYDELIRVSPSLKGRMIQPKSSET